MTPQDCIIVALDVDRLEKAKCLIESLKPHVGYFKVGLELITALGAPAVLYIIGGNRVFYDGKFCDIPKTVEKASAETARKGVRMFNIHASCGVAAMEAGIRAAKGENKDIIGLAVTVLTSLSSEDCETVFGASSKAKVLQFARDAQTAGMDGIVCSPLELEFLKGYPELNNLIRVTPGIRMSDSTPDDQRRTATPAEAIANGADYLVIGRPITWASDPVASVNSIAMEIKQALELKEVK